MVVMCGEYAAFFCVPAYLWNVMEEEEVVWKECIALIFRSILLNFPQFCLGGGGNRM
jgi:hypothetical protein